MSRLRAASPPLVVAALVAAATACRPDAPEPAAEPAGPALVALVVVDQLRADLVERYDTFFTGGLRRLLDEGRVFTGASHAHAFTETAAGHATLATGSFPSHHGIVANNFNVLVDDSTWGPVYAVADTTAPLVGFPALEGRSPRPMLRTTLADWVLAADPRARALSVSKKDRAAITMGATTSAPARNHAYWIVQSAGRFATSDFYRTRYPDWVEIFNREQMPGLFDDSVWANTAPPAAQARARDDAAPYEADGVHTTFPHVFATEVPEGGPTDLLWWAETTPQGDRAVLDFVAAGLDALELGRRGATDYLAVSFSQTDYVGHRYGPLSQEQLVNLLHLDRVLGELLTLLDARVGEGRWVLGFSADHGVLTMPEYLAAQGQNAGRTPPDYEQEVARLLQEAITEGTTDDEIRTAVARRLETLPYVADVLTPDELEGEPADSFVALYRNSRHPERRNDLPAFDLMVRGEPYMLITNRAQGTSHGSPYWYDRSVPLVVLGPGVGPGRSNAAVYTADLAPTLAWLAGIDFPEDLDGETRVSRP